MQTDTKVFLEEEEDLEQGGLYPYNPLEADLDVREEPQTVYELVVRKFERGKLLINPDFQRNFVWKPRQMSQFIESVILNFPLPPLYLNQDKEGRYIVVDGLQRITTLQKFLNNEFELKGLEALTNLNGSKFKDLDDVLQFKIEDKKLNIYLIKPSVPINVVYDIFYRINTKGTKLNRQEIRNCIFLGKATQFLKKLAAKKIFQTATGGSIPALRMKDQEVVLRYLAFQILDYNTYNGSVNDFVENAMLLINTKMDVTQLEALEQNFERVMQLTFEFFGRENFRFPTEKTRGSINIALLESVCYFFATHSDDFLRTHKNRIQQNFQILLQDKAYRDAAQQATGDKARVKMRFERALFILGNVKN